MGYAQNVAVQRLLQKKQRKPTGSAGTRGRALRRAQNVAFGQDLLV